MNLSFLKWLGGKSKLVDQIKSLMPKNKHKRFIEPFAGSLVVSMNVNAEKHIVNDFNKDLIFLYRHVRDNYKSLLKELEKIFVKQNNTQEKYIAFRKEFNSIKKNNIRRSALFVYLNRHGFNGLCRYNSNGEFNVGFGKYKTVNLPAEMLANTNRVLNESNFQFYSKDFRHFLKMAKEGDVVYCDPPYAPFDELRGNLNFTGYVPSSFDLKEQLELAQLAAKAAKRGALVIISNHSTWFTRQLYGTYGAKIKFLNVKRSVSCKGDNRQPAPELFAIFN